MLRRRQVGVAVVVLGLLAAVIVPVAVGRTIPGTAQAVPVPGPPTTGSCVGQAFDASKFTVLADPTHYSYPDMTAGECSRPHFGEVVAVIPRPTKPVIQIDRNGGFSIDDKNTDHCFAAAAAFLGLPAAGTGPLFGYWSIPDFAPVVSMQPNARQRAAGQRWLACVTYLTDQSNSKVRPPVAYRGSLRSAQSTGLARNYRGSCPTDVDWNQTTTVDCLLPHHGEIFANGYVDHDVARTTLTSTCAQLIAQVTKTDLLGDRRLTVDVQATSAGSGETLAGATIPADSSLQCGVLTSRGLLLKGSVLAIGNEPIPWA